jgi:hypothetical protein
MRCLVSMVSVALLGCGAGSQQSQRATAEGPRAGGAGGVAIVASEGAVNRAASSSGGARPSGTGEVASASASARGGGGDAGDGEILSFEPGFRPDPIIRRGIAGGPRSADTFEPSCPGFVSAAPSFLLKVDRALAELRILVSTQGDATLLVQLEDGRVLCNDDTEGLNPVIAAPLPAGRHRVWVGTYGSDVTDLAYTIAFTAQAALSAAAIDALPATP